LRYTFWWFYGRVSLYGGRWVMGGEGKGDLQIE